MRFSSLCVVIHNNTLEATNNLDKMSNTISIYTIYLVILFIKFHKTAHFKTSLLVTQKDCGQQVISFTVEGGKKSISLTKCF